MENKKKCHLLNRRRALIQLGFGTGAALLTYLSQKGWLKMIDDQKKSPLFPTLFLGHGSPMNAITSNSITKTLTHLGEKLPPPQAILVISAHWMTRGTWVTSMDKPRTIHDFYGFPEPLYKVQYPAPGAPYLAQQLQKNWTSSPPLQLDYQQWGLDHGTWSVLKYLYPKAQIPVLQMSIDINQSPLYHYELGQKLQPLREQGVLIVGSGNIVHNLNLISWEENARPFDWALEFDHWVKAQTLSHNHEALIKDYLKHPTGKMSVPTVDHYLPFLTVLGTAKKTDELIFDVEGFQNASISMRSFRFNPKK